MASSVATGIAADCVFCAIVAGTADGAVVGSNEFSTAFLDRRPLFPGHVLVVPRPHVVTLLDLPPGDVGPLFVFVREVAAAVTAAMNAHGSFVALNNIVSQSVPHLHVHVVPRRRGDGLRGFFWPRQRYADSTEMDRVAAQIRAALAARSE